MILNLAHGVLSTDRVIGLVFSKHMINSEKNAGRLLCPFCGQVSG